MIVVAARLMLVPNESALRRVHIGRHRYFFPRPPFDRRAASANSLNISERLVRSEVEPPVARCARATPHACDRLKGTLTQDGKISTGLLPTPWLIVGDILNHERLKMMDDDFVRARTALRSFMLEMNHWEKGFYKQKRSALESGLDVSEVDDCARKALSGIFERWTLRDKTNQGRLIDLGCSDPPTYDPETDVEDGVESTGGEVVFIIRQTVGMLAIFRITMKNDAGEWRVRKKEFVNFKDKWQRSVL
ncbi:NTF2 fold immunity protein [Burkholderia cepacia]|uniref:NTF2 fold immunity protein n=1 Tax=Burkholderia cepacia TaxID=292 RepID=UPI003527941D